ncbi:MAG: Ig-like domain-containing protein, partial [Candidatus Paceibacterota bacterium]
MFITFNNVKMVADLFSNRLFNRASILVLVISIFVFGGLTPDLAQAQSVSLNDSGFESCTVATNPPPGWTVSNNNAGCMNNLAQAGTWRVFAVTNSYLHQPISLAAGINYTFGVYAMNVAGANPATLLISSAPGGGTTYCTANTQALGWTQISCSYTPVVNTTAYFNLVGGPNDPGSRFDEATVIGGGDSSPSTDITPPSVSMTSPTSGATVSGSVNVTATASDNVGVAGVQFKLDGANLGVEDTTSPY